MGLSKKFVKMKNDKRAEMGVGTMIIFIAMVLVAAVAASVLISTANTVREQAQETGDQAINNVASGFIVQDVIGQVNASDYQSIDNITIYVKLAAGSPQINMNNVVISLVSNDNNLVMDMGAAADSTTYVAAQYKEVSGNPWSTDMAVSHVVGQGDLIKITLTNDGNALSIGANEKCVISIQPAYGQPSPVTFVTDEAFTPNVEWVNL
jgi:flagellin FlaB